MAALVLSTGAGASERAAAIADVTAPSPAAVSIESGPPDGRDAYRIGGIISVRVGLFSEVEPAAARTRTRASASTDATTLRRRVVTMDLERLRRARAAASVLPRPPVRTKAVSPRRGKPDAAPAPDATLTLNLFQDVVFTGIVEWTAPTFSGGYSLSGRLAGKALGTLTLVVNGETVAGTVRTLGGTYRIRSAGDGLYAISQVEEPPLDCQVLKPEAEGGRPKPPSQ